LALLRLENITNSFTTVILKYIYNKEYWSAKLMYLEPALLAPFW